MVTGHIATQPLSHIAVQPYIHIATFLQSHRAKPHGHTSTWPQRQAAFGRPPFVKPCMAMQLCGHEALWLCGYVPMQLCSYVAMCLYGCVAMWLCGYVAMWLCGYEGTWLFDYAAMWLKKFVVRFLKTQTKYKQPYVSTARSRSHYFPIGLWSKDVPTIVLFLRIRHKQCSISISPKNLFVLNTFWPD